MFCIVLEFPKRAGGKDPKDLHWLAVHSFFEYLFPDEIVCVLKPCNKNDRQAKIFFKQKVTIPDGNNSVEIDNFWASIVDCHEEESLSVTRTRILPLPACPGNLDAIVSELSYRFKVRVTCLPDTDSDQGPGFVLSVTGCHEEVLEAALETLSRLLKCATTSATAAGTGTADMLPAAAPSVGPLSGAAATARVTGPTSAVVADSAAAGRRPRKPLFSPDAIAAADAAREAEEAAMKMQQQQQQQRPQQQQQQQPIRQAAAPVQSQPGVFSLSPACRLSIEHGDLTRLSDTDVDLLVATTSGALSLRFGLAKALASRWGFDAIETECQRHLKSVRGGQIPFGGSFLSQAGQILFVVLPNDRKLEGQLGRGRQFRQAVDQCLDDTLRQLVRLAGDKAAPGYQRVAMPTLGSTLPLWSEDNRDEWVDALASALARLAGRGAGHLSELRVFCVSEEAARGLGGAVARQLGRGGDGALGASRGSDGGDKSGAAVASAPPADKMDVEEDSAATAAAAASAPGDGCLLCANEFSSKNPPTPFHCQQPGGSLLLCGGCVARLNDPAQPSDGKCVVCFERYRPAVGNQPPGGKMNIVTEKESLPGHDGSGTIAITYEFGPGTHEGTAYKGATRTAYLPDSTDGQAILQRLHAAFLGRVIFGIGASATTGRQTAITWNTVHHKTSKAGGATRHGYPDEDYLKRTGDELSALGY